MAKKRLFLTFQLHACTNWSEKKDFFELTQLVKNKGNLLPYSNERVSLTPPGHTWLITQDRNVYFDRRYKKHDSWDDISFTDWEPKEEIIIPFRTTLLPEWNTLNPIQRQLVNIYLLGMSFGKKYNRIEVASSLVDEWWEKISIQDVLALFIRFTQPAIEMMRPNYGVMTVDQQVLVPYGREVLDRKLETIFWWNYFGPIYLEEYGKDIFLNAPGHRVEEVANGIWYQLTEKFTPDIPEKLKNEILEHFRPVGVSRINPPQYVENMPR